MLAARHSNGRWPATPSFVTSSCSATVPCGLGPGRSSRAAWRGVAPPRRESKAFVDGLRASGAAAEEARASGAAAGEAGEISVEEGRGGGGGGGGGGGDDYRVANTPVLALLSRVLSLGALHHGEQACSPEGCTHTLQFTTRSLRLLFPVSLCPPPMLVARHGAFKRALAGDTIVCNFIMFGNHAVWPRPWAELPGGLAWSCTVTPGSPRPLWTGFGQAARPRGRRERLR